MANKKEARSGANGTGVEGTILSDVQGKLPEFPGEIPDNFSLSDWQPVPERPDSGSPPSAKGNGQALINRIEHYFRGRFSFRYNEVKNTVEVCADGRNAWRDLDERQAKRLEADLLRSGFTGVEHTLNVFLANAPEFDPIGEYLNALPAWDGKTDHVSALSGFVEIEAARREWFDRMFKKHLVRALACATGRIPFNKQCFVLVSGQNDGKTSFLRFLCPPAWKEYYTEDIDFENKDGLIALARNIVINLDELRNLSRQDINKVKSYLTKDTIKARLPFDRRETKLRRHASFFGSTNNAEFLTDETGNVRWLVFEINGIRHDNGGAEGYGANVDINQVYAQCFALLNSGFEYQLTREEIEESERNNKVHMKKPIEYELILKFYKASTDKADFQTASDIKRHLEIQTLQKLPNVENIGKALKMLGIERTARKIRGQAVYGYPLKKVEEMDWDSDETENPDST